jgi:hypothetical protein
MERSCVTQENSMKISKAGGAVSVALMLSVIIFAYMALHLTATAASARIHANVQDLTRHLELAQQCKLDPIYCD